MRKPHRELRKLHKKFMKYYQRRFVSDAKFFLNVDKLRLDERVYESICKEYYLPTFVRFASAVKFVVTSEKVWEFLQRMCYDLWDFWVYIQFLVDEGIVKVEGEKISVLREDIAESFLPRLTKEQIMAELERRLGIKVGKLLSKPSFVPFSKLASFEWKSEEYDQLPISLSSAISLVEKILYYLPFANKFLLVGDDDFISLLLALVAPNAEILVVDLDEEVLSVVEKVSGELSLNVETKMVDVSKKKKVKGYFTGFSTNPPNQLQGIEKFVEFGVNSLSNDGGYCFVSIGDESIGKRYIFLQEFLAKKNLVIEELVKGAIVYPFVETKDREQREVLKRVEKLIPRRIVRKRFLLSEDLYVMHYIPRRPKKLKIPSTLLSYL